MYPPFVLILTHLRKDSKIVGVQDREVIFESFASISFCITDEISIEFGSNSEKFSYERFKNDSPPLGRKLHQLRIYFVIIGANQIMTAKAIGKTALLKNTHTQNNCI